MTAAYISGLCPCFINNCFKNTWNGKKGSKLGECYLNRTGVHNFLNCKMIVNYKKQEKPKNTFPFPLYNVIITITERLEKEPEIIWVP